MINDAGPILPINMHKIIIIFPHKFKVGVIPRDNPTVPRALVTSNRHFNKSFWFVFINREVAIEIIDEYRKKREKAFKIIKLLTFLLNRITLSDPLITLKQAVKMRKKVVVFIPPPVDPGEAPITMRIINIKIVSIDKDEILTVLKPAVLGVIAWKNASITEILLKFRK